MRKSKRQKNEQNKRRFEAIKNLMSTFAMSTVAVVAAVTLIPKSPAAEITKVVALSEEIVYQVNVTDEDNALDSSTLFVVLENQLEYYEQTISLGENSGFFDGLNFDTEYRLSVYGSKGFGQERLDTTTITTREKIGGTILSVTPSGVDHSTTYTVDISVFDPDSIYSSINLYYGYTWEHGGELTYSSIPVTMDRMEIELFDIFTEEPFHIYLEGTTTDGTVLLDEIWVTPPFQLYASLHIRYITNDTVGFHVYNDMDVGEMSYQMNVYKDETLVKSETFVGDSSDYEGTVFEVGDLLSNTMYWFECIATYVNPQTLRQEQTVIYEEEISTLSDYSYTYTIESFDTYLEVTITLQDPDDVFQIAYYDAYDTSSEHNQYLESNTYLFLVNGEEKSITFNITLPIVTEYEITIGMRNQNSFTSNQIIEIITHEWEE